MSSSETTTLLNWRASQSSSSDIGGMMFDECPYCGGKKEFRRGMDDGGDNTEQYINCTICGWRGYRSIKYSSDPWSSECSTSYSHSILLNFYLGDEIEDEIIDAYKLSDEKGNEFLFIALEDNNYKLLFNDEQEVERLESIEIDWSKKKVKFSFDYLTIDLTFNEANTILKYLDLLNYDLIEDYDMITQAIKDNRELEAKKSDNNKEEEAKKV